MAWACWSIQGFLAWKLLGIPLSQLISFFTFFYHLLSLIHACCFLFLPLCSAILCHSFWSLWESCGFQRVRKGQLYCPIGGRPRDKQYVTTCPCFSVNTVGVTALTPHQLTPCHLYIVPSCSHTHWNSTEQTHILRVVLVPTYTHTGTCALLL